MTNKRSGLIFIRFCHTCGMRKHRLVELSWLEGVHHRLKGHWVRTGYVGK